MEELRGIASPLLINWGRQPSVRRLVARFRSHKNSLCPKFRDLRSQLLLPRQIGRSPRPARASGLLLRYTPPSPYVTVNPGAVSLVSDNNPMRSTLSMAVTLALPLLIAQNLAALDVRAQSSTTQISLDRPVAAKETAETESAATGGEQTRSTSEGTGKPDGSIQQLIVTAELDWRPLPLVPPSQQDLRCRQCEGAFVDPLADQIPTEPGSTDVQVSADESSSDKLKLSFQGDVSVRQGNRSLRADSVQVDRNQQITTAEGNIGYREPGVALLGDSFEYDSGTREATITNARFVLHQTQMSGTANTLERQSTGQIDIDEGAMTDRKSVV